MPISYPASVDTTTTFPADVTDDTDSKAGTPRTGLVGWLAQWIRDAGAGILALETEIGPLAKGTFTNVAARLNARLTVRKTADETFSTVTLTNVTNMSFAVAAGQDYRFMFSVPFTAAALTTGIGIGITCPALTGYISATVTIPRLLDAAGTAPASSAVYVGQITSSGDSVVADATPVITPAVITATVEGTISNPSASGTLQLQVRTEVAASNIVVKRGAYGELYLN